MKLAFLHSSTSLLPPPSAAPSLPRRLGLGLGFRETAAAMSGNREPDPDPLPQQPPPDSKITEGGPKKEDQDVDLLQKELGEPPEKPLPGDCCGSGCVRCVWDTYFEELDLYNSRKAAVDALRASR